MRIPGGIKTVLTINGRGRTIVVECRRCGTSLDSTDEDCPYCGPTNVVTYEIR